MAERKKKVQGGIILALLAAAGMCRCFAYSGIFPFGENSNLFSDLATQYVNFLVFFRNSTWAEKIFSLTKGFGGQTFGLLSYYTFSPFNFIVYLFRPENIEMALFAIFVARAVFMAENMYCYLSRHFENILFNIAIALMYTFYPFFARYYFNILWFDCFALLPLLILGTERIMDGKSGRLFVAAYVYSLVSNYYIAYMSSIFVLCWFVYRFVLQHGFRIGLAAKKAFTMAYYAAMGIMFSAPVLIPSYYLLAQGKFSDDTISHWSVVKPYDIATLPVTFFEGAMVYEYTPHFVGSVICIFLLVAYLFNKKINRKEKAVTTLFFMFMVAGFAFRILGYVWHGFSAPQGFHNRQTYVYAFLMLVICRQALENIDFSTCVRTLAAVLPLYAVAWIRAGNSSLIEISTQQQTATAVTVIVTVVCMLGIKFSPSAAKTALGIYMCGIAVYMGMYCMNGQYQGDKPYTMAPSAGRFRDSYRQTESLLAQIDDAGFYRIEDPTRWSQNQAMTHGYYSTSHYSSVFETQQKEMYMYFGYDDTYYSTTYSRSLPLTDFVFGVKYVLCSDTSLVTDHYECIYTGAKNIYENPFRIPVVYTGPANNMAFEEYWVDTVNNMTVALTGIDIYRRDGNADYTKLKDIAAIIREKACTVVENNGMFLSFKADATQDRYLLSSLMYDENWRITVNSVPVQPERYMNYFLSVPLQQGTENLIQMTYIPQGMPAGIAIMAVAVAVSVIQTFINKKKKSHI